MSGYHKDHENYPRSDQNDQRHQVNNGRSQIPSTIDFARTHAVGGSVEHHQAGGLTNDPTSTSSIQLSGAQAQNGAFGFTCRKILKLDGSVCGSRSYMGTGICLQHQNAISSPLLTNDVPDVEPCLVSQRDDTTAPILEDERNSGNVQHHSDVASTSFDTRLRYPEPQSYSESPIKYICDRCRQKEASNRNTRYGWCDDCDKFCHTWNLNKCEAIWRNSYPCDGYRTTGKCDKDRHCARIPLLALFKYYSRYSGNLFDGFSVHDVAWGEWFPGRPEGVLDLDYA